MKASKIFLWAFLITVCSTVAQAQTLKLGPENNTANIIASPQVITLDYNDFATIAVSSNYPYNNIHSDADWLTWKLQKNGNIAIFAQPNYNLNSRSTYLNIEIDPQYKDKVSNVASSMVFLTAMDLYKQLLFLNLSEATVTPLLNKLDSVVQTRNYRNLYQRWIIDRKV